MKFKESIQQIIRFTALTLGVILVVLLSCTVRKSIQTYLDIPVVSVTNVSKTALNTISHCSLEEKVEGIQSIQKVPDCIILFLLLPVVGTLFLQKTTHSNLHSKDQFFSWFTLPKYILYQKMKILA
ncbi:hypothetical protein [Flavobacterium sp. '19STA2R22 D10 B1']|uniref:hypothetical protein n=1 Tax=Flavobacterium aerium TaxID=3037261 RepID=UPI00278BEBB4|nr:hypothetical protein [Flavobacterium sp. '19STA2R22 D10 B1']